MSVFLSVEQVSKSYGKTQALKDISFELNAGFYALLGANGAGKSTLFQLLTGVFTPDQGQIQVYGLDIRHQLPQALKHIGVVFQQSSLDLGLSVERNLHFYGALHGLSKADIQQRLAQLLPDLGLDDVLKKPCRALSGGNRRKVELARALLTQPKILLMDEATVGLDPASRESLLQTVQALAASEKVCVLWATHLIDEVEQADEILVLNKGKLLAKAQPEDLLQKTNTDSLLAAFLQLSNQKLLSQPESIASSL